MQSPVHLVIPLALVGKVVAVPAQKVSVRLVKDCHPPAASRARADKPRLLSPEVARRPLQGHGLPYILPLLTRSTIAVGENQVVPVHKDVNGGHFSLRSPPRPREPVTRLEQPFPVEPTDVEAAALVCGSLTIPPVPVTGPYAAHRRILLQHFAEIIRQVYSHLILDRAIRPCLYGLRHIRETASVTEFPLQKGALTPFFACILLLMLVLSHCIVGTCG